MVMQNAIINVNGQIVDADRASVPVFDRGFLYGDSLYEVVRSDRGVFLHLDEHLTRLEQSAQLCRMVLGQSLVDYRREIALTFDAFKKLPGMKNRDAYCRLIVTRGIGKIGFGLACLLSPTQYVILVQPLDLPTSQQLARGLKLKVVERLRNDPRALDPAMKSGNYLNSLLAYLESAAESYDDALMCNAEGHVTEGTTFNIFYVRDGIVATPPLEIGMLDGITRRETLRLAREHAMPVREVRFPKSRFYEADEVFVTSTIKEVFPVTNVDGKKIGTGRPGPITLKLRELYRHDADQRVRAGNHPQDRTKERDGASV